MSIRLEILEKSFGRTPLWHALHRDLEFREDEGNKLNSVASAIEADPSQLKKYFLNSAGQLESPLFTMYLNRSYSAFPSEGLTLFQRSLDRVGLDWILPEEIPRWIQVAIERQEFEMIDRIAQSPAFVASEFHSYLGTWIQTSISGWVSLKLQRYLEVAVRTQFPIQIHLSKWIQLAIEFSSFGLDELLRYLPWIEAELELEIPKWVEVAIDTNRESMVNNILSLEVTSRCDFTPHLPRWIGKAVRGGKLKIVEAISTDLWIDEKGIPLLELVPVYSTSLFVYLLQTRTWSPSTIAKAMFEPIHSVEEDFSDSEDETEPELLSRFVICAKSDFETAQTWIEYLDPILADPEIPTPLVKFLRAEIGTKLMHHLYSNPRPCYNPIPPSKYHARFVTQMAIVVKVLGATGMGKYLDTALLCNAAIEHHQFEHLLFLIWLGCKLPEDDDSNLILDRVAFPYPDWDPGYTDFELISDSMEIPPTERLRHRGIILRALDPTIQIPPNPPPRKSIGWNCFISEEERLAIREKVYFSRSLVEKLLYFI